MYMEGQLKLYMNFLLQGGQNPSSPAFFKEQL